MGVTFYLELAILGTHLLTRPLSYKGPVDQLRQHFSLTVLYRGLKLLFEDSLMDWQFVQQGGSSNITKTDLSESAPELIKKDDGDNQVTAIFVQQEQLIKTSIIWPLVDLAQTANCTCQEGLMGNWGDNKASQSEPTNSGKQTDFADQAAQSLIDVSRNTADLCEHMAALAIESKVRLERLPPPLKRQNTFNSEAGYVKHWLGQQQFDPFPNMARHRVVYLLDEDEFGWQVSIHKAYLTQQNEFQRKAELDLDILYQKKLPKFISLTDQQILHDIQKLSRQTPELVLSKNALRLAFPEGMSLLQRIVQSHRSFWRSCHRQPLIWHKRFFADTSVNIENKKTEIQSGLNHGAVEATELPHKLWKNDSYGLFFSKKQGEFIEVENSNLFDELSRSLIPDEVSSQHSEQLTSAPWLENIIPSLQVSSFQAAFSWQKPVSDVAKETQFELARVAFLIGQQAYSFEQIWQYSEQLSETSRRLLQEKIGGWLHQLDALAGIHQYFEPPISEQFDITDRYLKEDISHCFILFRGLQREGWQIEFEPQFSLNQVSIDQWYSQVSLAEHNEQMESWFELDIGIRFGDRQVNMLPYLVEAIESGRLSLDKIQSGEITESDLADFSLTLDDGSSVKLSSQRLYNIISCLLELTENKPLNQNARLRLPVSQFARLSELQQQMGSDTRWQDAEWLKQKAMRLSLANEPPEIPLPDNIHATLRDYQHQGVNWLQFLVTENLGGILADDMGLGKTLQTLAHIQIEKNAGRLIRPALVVAPTSLLGNWLNECRRFTPGLKVLQWAGNKRQQKQAELSQSDLIITSYGILARDAKLLNELQLYLLILDEAQTIKNASSKIARTVFQFEANHRLCLSGTPLENHLGELWSLFNFLMPGFLGEQAQFRRLFRLPIEKENDYQRQQQLAQRIAPFMLRRTKEKVAADLPQKTTINTLIELTDLQTDRYESIRLSMLEQVQKALHGGKKNAIAISNALLRLRQVCCHAELMNLKRNNAPDIDAQETIEVNKAKSKVEAKQLSAKLNWLNTKIPELIENNRRVLIFSSFTSMLDIIAKTLTGQKIRYLKLTGQSTNRSQLIDEFQQGEIPVFLISLKAGGAGLNLTQADTVIHFDPWWNPAAENQASDRAHRIGQDKPVFVYKLITQGTVEEKIVLMQKHKGELAEQLYKESAEQLSLTQMDWEALLAPIDASNE